ncbi:ABC transporter permease subunit [Pseudooceanicola sp. GBMRC 2024]|uniref:ABC transporter permease subunit n=2 Tax=Paracoccaceae TaxID=31989 RepID=A0A6L7G5L3_9RHOB|nr:ABC transporter permease subunit [Pseudooceanicola albus]
MTRDYVLSIASVAAVLLLWQAASTWLVDPMFLPTPVAVLAGGWQMLKDGTLLSSMGISLMRILCGWVLGSLIAVPLGLAVGVSRTARALIDPFIHFFRFVPAIALVTLFIVWFGVGEFSKIVLIAYATAFIVMVNTASGVSGISQDKLNAARCLGASPRQVFLRVTVPAALPSIYIGMRLALASSFLVIAAAEMLAANAGLGYIIWTARLYFQVDWMFAAIIVLGLLGFTADRLWRMIGRRWLAHFLRGVTGY